MEMLDMFLIGLDIPTIAANIKALNSSQTIQTIANNAVKFTKRLLLSTFKFFFIPTLS